MNQTAQRTDGEGIGEKIGDTIENAFGAIYTCSLNLGEEITKEDMIDGFGNVSTHHCYEDALHAISTNSHHKEVIATIRVGQDLSKGIINNITAIKLTLQENPDVILLIQPQNSQDEFQLDLVSADLENGLISNVQNPAVISKMLGYDLDTSTEYAVALQQFSENMFDNLKNEF